MRLVKFTHVWGLRNLLILRVLRLIVLIVQCDDALGPKKRCSRAEKAMFSSRNFSSLPAILSEAVGRFKDPRFLNPPPPCKSVSSS